MSPSKRQLLGIIADDVTGASDVAGHLVSEGLRTVQYFGIPANDAAPASEVDCVVIALKTRSVEAADAVAQSLAAFRWLHSIGAGHLYFKYCSTFDSTARGNIGPVLDALAAASSTGLVIVAPSAPDNGRTVYQGKLFVGDRLLEESPLKDHPLNPMHDSDLQRILMPQSRRSSGLIRWQTVVDGPDAVGRRLAELARADVGIGIADAVQTTDLDKIAAALLAAGHTFSSGSAGLAAAIGRQWEPRVPGERMDEAPQGPAVILSGSCSASTRAQVERYRVNHPSYSLDPVLIANDPHELDRARSFVREHRDAAPLLYSSVDQGGVARAQGILGVERAASIVEWALADIAREAHAVGIRRFIVAGGETSGAVTEALGVTEVVIGAQVAVGVPWCVSVGEDPCALLLKSGNFGGADFFFDAVEGISR